MPKKACCCDPKGRHVAVACRYYGGHAIRYVKDSIPASSGVSGFTGDIRFIGPDGFKTGTTGFQRVFGYSAGVSGFGNPTGIQVRGPYKWEVNIERFDATRDVVFLTRSGGGSSQYDWNGNQDAPRGGHSSLLQTRIKASLATEAFVGAGGTLFSGGQGSAIGACLAGRYNPNSVAGAGAGGGILGRGGHGGLTNGIVGLNSGGGKPGTQTAGGCAGGSFAYDGTEFNGGSGGPDSGWGGGGRYSGGGGDNKAGGGGGASKWPNPISGYNDIRFSQEGSDRGPGNLCDPFINYYTVAGNNTAFAHAGMAGGANLVADSDPNFPQPQTTFLGFGNDFNPLKEGVPGIIKALWIDKYCPCDETKNELPDKMYICLTDAQFTKIKDEIGYDPSIEYGKRPKFDLDGETYIYLGICINAYCSDVRLLDGDPENIKLSDINSGSWLDGPAGKGQFMNDCCKTIISWPICKIQTPNCYDCNNCYTCVPPLKPKYCCEDVDSKPDLYWSVYEGWLWQSIKSSFWFPFGVKPEDALNSAKWDDVVTTLGNATSYIGGLAGAGFEKLCLNVDGTGPAPSGDLCGSILSDSDCDQYSLFVPPPASQDHSCRINVGDWWDYPHPEFLPIPINISGTICGKGTEWPRLSWVDTGDINSCECQVIDYDCLPGTACLEPNEVGVRYNSFCSATPVVINGDFGCFMNQFVCSPYITCDKFGYDITQYMNPILGMTITIPKCPGTNFPSTSGISLTSMCGRSIKILNGFGLSLGTIAATMNNNPFGVIYQANEPKIFITERPGAQVCSEVEGYSIPNPLGDIQVSIQTTDTPTSIIQKYYYKPRSYLYKIQLYANGCAGSGTPTCSGLPNCECISPFYSSSALNTLSQNCLWGFYNLAKMTRPVFLPGSSNLSRGTCSISPSLLSQINGDLRGSGLLSDLSSSEASANCIQYSNACFTSIENTFKSCSGKVSGSVG